MQSRGSEDELRPRLVEAGGTGEHPTADVGDIDAVEESLDRAVLTPTAVQGRDGDIDPLEHPDHRGQPHRVDGPPRAIPVDEDVHHVMSEVANCAGDAVAAGQ